MHPNEKPLDDVSFHRPRGVQRRRSSLDNSSLAATDSFVAALLLSDDEKHEFAHKERRLSLGTKLEDTPTTFLAFANQQSPSSQAHKSKAGLDADRHDSDHSPRWRPSYHSKTSDTKDTINTSSYSSSEEEPSPSRLSARRTFEVDSSDESSIDDDDSDCDSFCDASADEPANRSYLRTDLGASVMWSDVDSLDGNLDFVQDSWGGGAMEGGAGNGGERTDSQPGKPRRSSSGGSSSNAFRNPPSPRRAPFRNSSSDSSKASAPHGTPRRSLSSGSSGSAATPSPARRMRRHLAVKRLDQILADEGEE